MCISLQAKHLLLLYGFNQNQKVSASFSKNSKYEISLNSDQWELRCSM